ncbi:hypothetical protein GCM10023198_43830 [Promicromonospora umidemergens]|uniref:Uncharacterized protein n=1 Tax=Promicromonospora umidemergens TaxID=629679 RepID=A0ABP8XUN9_9MICO
MTPVSVTPGYQPKAIGVDAVTATQAAAPVAAWLPPIMVVCAPVPGSPRRDSGRVRPRPEETLAWATDTGRDGAPTGLSRPNAPSRQGGGAQAPVT